MIQFKSLRLNGFKSFADRTELDIGTGLNGIVGPNGCGKSNLVEGMRWVMGESSAKKMRGEGMEDVIFAGTAKRSAKNIAEVALLMDNQSRTAPAQFNNSDEIEIVRRIEKDHGSTYKINGKTVRARDVQLLLADTVTGANSPALVSQGRITQIINSKPSERRMVLEESAGISGLFARRHEAELRLKAADSNLVRLEDVLGNVESQLASLKRQARQASRYRNLNAQIRQLEALIAYLEWKTLEDRRRETNSAFVEADKTVAEKMLAVTQLTKTQTTQAENLPSLRKAEAEAAATLQTRKIALQRIEDEATRLEAMIKDTSGQLDQTRHDEGHEESSANETALTLENIQLEEKTLLDEQKSDDGRLEEKDQARQTLEEKVHELDARYTALMQSEAEAKAKREALESQLGQNRQRLSVLERRYTQAQQDQERLQSGIVPPAQIKTEEQDIARLEQSVVDKKASQQKQEDSLNAAKEQKDTLDKTVRDFQSQISEIKTEIGMLESFLDEDAQSHTILLDEVSANPGFEKALSRALGDSLMAALEEGSSAYWIQKSFKGDFPALPAGITALQPQIKAPELLKLSLSQIGYVEDEAAGQKAVHSLQPGQSIVSKDGHYWRWDGYCIKASAKDRNAQHLEYKNKLADLNKSLPALDKKLEKEQSALAKITASIQEYTQSIAALRPEIQSEERQISDKTRSLSQIKEKQARQSAELEAIAETLKTQKEDKDALTKTVKDEEIQLQAYLDSADQKSVQDREELHKTLQDAREAHQDAIRIFERQLQHQNTRKARLQVIADERVNLKNRNIRANERLKTLSSRRAELEEKLAQLRKQPVDFEDNKNALLNEISKLESVRSEAAEQLQICETEVLETGKALKTAENALGEARESRAHAQATLAGLVEQLGSIKARIDEKFECPPEKLLEHISMDESEISAGNLEKFKSQKEKLVIEREGLGAVNLRAEEEALEIERETGKLLNERNDLVQAIEELRQAIQKINKEARARLIVAFEHVNGHFKNLFSRLFQGGQAHLSLIDSEDPLGAGLEIFAQPPGKSLQSLSLLSGGEQTLASIALIFAMFLTNPSPICVLDEIDAPLDDSNVDRLCDMLDEIADRGETRFLIVTHHRLTMARMDRLYGVTMAERGISQLVSVDLQQSFSFLDEAA